MRMKFVFAAPLLAFALSVGWVAAGPGAMAGSDYASKILAGYEKTGNSKSCIRLSMVRDSDPLDDFAILFEVRGGALYLNELSGRCSNLGKQKRFSYQTTQAQICEGDIISVTDSFGTHLGGCSLGAFQELSPLPVETASN